MQGIKQVVALIVKGKFSEGLGFFIQLVHLRLRHMRDRRIDKKIGGKDLSGIYDSRFKEKGAFRTQSTDYRCLDAVFESRPLKENDVFMDIGCGEGRVLTYLYMKKFAGRIMGIEIDEQVAEIAKKRTANCKNIEIYCGRAADSPDAVKDCTAFYLFNPFDGKVLLEFVEMLEKQCEHPFVLYYLNDLFSDVIDKREHWKILRRQVVKRRYYPDMRFTVYKYNPEK